MYGGGHGKEQEGPVKQKNLRSPGSRGEERKHRYASEVSTWRVMLTGGRTSEGGHVWDHPRDAPMAGPAWSGGE